MISRQRYVQDFITFEVGGGSAKCYRFPFGKNYADLGVWTRDADFIKISFGASNISPFLITIAITGDGRVVHVDTVATTGMVARYAHIDTVSNEAQPPTDRQVDTVIKLLDGGREILPGWMIDFTLGATVQSWLQMTTYGKKRITAHYEGIPLSN